jgi:hypothetical protein
MTDVHSNGRFTVEGVLLAAKVAVEAGVRAKKQDPDVIEVGL